MNEAPDTAIDRLHKQIARLQEAIALREMDRAEVTIALLSNPNDPERKAQLAKAAQDINDWRDQLEGAEGALVLQQQRDLEAEELEAETARQGAAAGARAVLADSLKAAAKVDKAIDAFVAALADLNENYRQASRLSYDAGVRGNQRHNLISNLLSVKHAGGVLAARLLLAGLHDRLDNLIVTRPGFDLNMTLTEMVKGTSEKVSAQIDRALAGD
jgi:tetratricopeptide (TPR) repeat protein